MKPWERISITLLVCLTVLAAVWLHGRLNRYEVLMKKRGDFEDAVRYDRITGRTWLIIQSRLIELGTVPE